ncbi:hypothetical protein DN614_25055 [Klebsiella michiganensis]|nr:hypothetical protein DN614_25055 [Klebsiella michiganensis]
MRPEPALRPEPPALPPPTPPPPRIFPFRRDCPRITSSIRSLTFLRPSAALSVVPFQRSRILLVFDKRRLSDVVVLPISAASEEKPFAERPA